MKSLRLFITEQESALHLVIKGNMQREFEAGSHKEAMSLFHDQNPNLQGEVKVFNSEKEERRFFITVEGKIEEI